MQLDKGKDAPTSILAAGAVQTVVQAGEGRSESVSVWGPCPCWKLVRGDFAHHKTFMKTPSVRPLSAHTSSLLCGPGRWFMGAANGGV